MRQRQSVLRRTGLFVASTVVLGTSVAVSPIAAAAPAADTVTCRANAAVYYTRPDSYLDLDRHNEPETGVSSWTGRATVGNGWVGRTLAGPDGWVYRIDDGGVLNRLRRSSTGWENAGISEKIATGWYGWTLPAFRNRVTADSLGDFYWVHDDILGWLHYDETTKAWTDRVIATGWQPKYDLIVAAGDGVIYSRTPAGVLYRSQYNAASQRWVEYETQVGAGWQNFATIASAGGDILYALDKTNGQLMWYRYLGNGQWADFKVLGTGISSDTQVTVTTDECKLVNPGLPQRPAVPARPDAASYILEGVGGKLQYFYIDGFGRLIHGRQRSEDVTLVDFAVVPGYQEYVGTPSALRNSDDSLLVTALGQDSETRSSTQAPATTNWPKVTGFGGWMPGPTVLARRSNLGAAFSVDAGGKLWSRQQDPGSKLYMPWRVQPSAGLSTDLTAVVQEDGIDLFARTTAGLYTKATFVDGVLGPWITVPGTGWTGKAAAVANPDKNLQVFATQPDGVVVTQRELAGGFTGTWKPLAGVTAAGVPTASVDSGGIVHVAVRATDGYIYVTEQSAPGSGGYRTWERLTDSRTGAAYQSATDPALVSRTAGGVAVTFRDSDGVSYAYATGGATAASARSAAAPTTGFTGGPLPKPAF